MQAKVKRFYKSQEDFRQFYFTLKQTACPHCRLSGYLNLHGYLRGYAETSCYGKVIRGRRIFCCNRNRRLGCGRTFSVLAFNVLKKFIIRTESLWRFLNNIAAGKNKNNSLRSLKLGFSASSAYRLWRRFCLSQTKIRLHLLKFSSPPVLDSIRKPPVQTILHIKAAFGNASCPIAAFQDYFQLSFL